MKSPLLLCYNLSGERGSQIKLLAMRHMIRLRPVKPDEYGQPLGYLCGAEQASEVSISGSFEDEMLVLAYFTREQLSQFLAAFRNAKIAPVSLKAVLTETNMNWNSIALHEELSAERDALMNGNVPVHEAAAKTEDQQ